MSDDNHANQPPVDTPLPDDLAQCESLLSRMPLPRSRVQRDELIYRAGWAAAEVHAKPDSLHAGNQQPSSGSVSRHSTLAWSVVSATIAASLAVAITLRLQLAAVPPLDSRADAVVDVPSLEDSTIVQQRNPPSESLAILTPGAFGGRRDVDWTASLLIMRDRALLQQWDDRWVESESSMGESLADDGIYSQPKTSREMLQEFLPGRSGQDTSDRDSTRRGLRWPWKTTRLGDTI